MTSRLDAIIRPGSGIDYRSKSKQRVPGFVLAFVGVLLAVVTLIANIAAANGDAADAPETLAWSFGLTTTAFAAVKFGITVILIGILVSLFLRVQSVKESLPASRLKVTAPSPRARLRRRWAPERPALGLPVRCPCTRWRSECGRRCWPWA